MEDLIGVANDIFDVYKDGEVDAVYIAYNKFVNTMAQKPVYQQLIPLPALETDNLEQDVYKRQVDYIPQLFALISGDHHIPVRAVPTTDKIGRASCRERV